MKKFNWQDIMKVYDEPALDDGSPVPRYRSPYWGNGEYIAPRNGVVLVFHEGGTSPVTIPYMLRDDWVLCPEPRAAAGDTVPITTKNNKEKKQTGKQLDHAWKGVLRAWDTKPDMKFTNIKWPADNYAVCDDGCPVRVGSRSTDFITCEEMRDGVWREWRTPREYISAEAALHRLLTQTNSQISNDVLYPEGSLLMRDTHGVIIKIHGITGQHSRAAVFPIDRYSRRKWYVIERD